MTLFGGHRTLIAFTIKVTDCPIHKYTLLTYCGKYPKESKDVKYQISLPEKIVANSDVDIVLI